MIPGCRVASARELFIVIQRAGSVLPSVQVSLQIKYSNVHLAIDDSIHGKDIMSRL